MTDMRATERLLEYVAEQRAIAANWTIDPAAKDALDQIESAVTELRRRGDTLVRREDLLVIAAGMGGVTDDIDAARERIQNALGGMP